MGKLMKLTNLWDIAAIEEVYINIDNIQTIEISKMPHSLVKETNMLIKITMSSGEIWKMACSEEECDSILKKLGHIDL